MIRDTDAFSARLHKPPESDSSSVTTYVGDVRTSARSRDAWFGWSGPERIPSRSPAPERCRDDRCPRAAIDPHHLAGTINSPADPRWRTGTQRWLLCGSVKNNGAAGKMPRHNRPMSDAAAQARPRHRSSRCSQHDHATAQEDDAQDKAPEGLLREPRCERQPHGVADHADRQPQGKRQGNLGERGLPRR